MPGTAREFPKMNKRIKSRKFKVLIICILFFAVSFSALEILARVRLNKIRGGYPAGMYVYDDELGYKYKPNFTGSFFGIYKNISITINSDGFRDYEHESNNNSARILAIGDSVTFGPAVAQEKIFTKYLETTLNDRGVNAEIFNMGVDGYDAYQEEILAMREAGIYHPKIILINFVLNDIKPFNKENDVLAKVGYPKCALCRAAAFYLTLYLIPKYNTAYFSYTYNLWKSEAFDQLKIQIRELNEFCKSENITLAYAIFPYTDQFNSSYEEPFLPQQLLEDELSKDGIPYVDLRDVLENCSSCYLTGDSVHLNERGSRAIAEKISSFLEENNLI